MRTEKNNKMPKDEESQSLLDKENGKTDYSADGDGEAVGKNAFS